MLNRKFIFPAFIILVVIQLFVPAQMIFQQEKLLSSGKAFKFKTAPVDPTDYFRGKYVQLSFAHNRVEASPRHKWNEGESVYASLITNEEGFAVISEVTKRAPDNTEDYIMATIRRSTLAVGLEPIAASDLILDFPFDRFYMEESKAQMAENLYREAMRDGASNVAYALVNVKNGSSVLKNVMLNDVPLQELVESTQKRLIK